MHPWILCSEKGKLTRYEVRHLKNKANNHLYINYYSNFFQGIEMFMFSNKYFWKGKLFFSIEGSQAKKTINFVKKSKDYYPYKNRYSYLGPNSNTYVQWVLDSFPMLNIELPRNAIGKNYHRKKK